MNKKITETKYTHKNKGKTYTILHHAEMQIKDEWIPCLVYKQLENGKIYVRSEQSFDEMFEIMHKEN